MTANGRSRIADTLRAATPLVIIALASVILLRFPPEQYSFYPQCPIYRYLHIECPGCGTTRALAALLHGHILEAFRLNALITSLMPPAAIYAVLCYCRFLQGKTLRLPHLPSAAVYAALAVAAAFMVVRNLPHI
ncbi:DUF2752 domain-containing protein [Edaphobacter paludis]|uniref:DUF2752 domain-containing protein n=1 Tax=Edaphobacter paludis TaxID=3035702 RepID=A0AAU7CZC4_9BACT